MATESKIRVPVEIESKLTEQDIVSAIKQLSGTDYNSWEDKCFAARHPNITYIVDSVISIEVTKGDK